jgi:hypothetical protein
MSHYFLNEDHTYTPCDLMTWAIQFEEMSRNHTKHVGSDRINGFHVSTVWLGLDHAWLGGPPLLFETMIFDNKEDRSDIYQDRYTTWDEAVEGHKRAIQWVLDGCI